MHLTIVFVGSLPVVCSAGMADAVYYNPHLRDDVFDKKRSREFDLTFEKKKKKQFAFLVVSS